MMKDIYVQARTDHVASLAGAAPTAAVEELVWNALDADAHDVRVDVLTNPLGGIEAVRVADDGTGIDVSRADETFGSLGGSWKRADGVVTKADGRRLHGRHGRGRFKAFALGAHVEWRTTLKTDGALASYVLSGDASEPNVFHVAQSEKPGPATGTEVFITNIRSAAVSLLEASAVVQTLAAKFALYLKAYPTVRVWFNGIPVSPVVVQHRATDYTLSLPHGETAKLEIIEWRRRFAGSGRLVFCGGDGFARYDRPAGVRTGWGYSFTAYLVSPRIDALAAENALMMDELHPEVRACLDAARKTIRAHFRVRMAEDAEARLARWIAEKSYPYAADDTSPARVAFDAAVADLRAHLECFDALPSRERAYLFQLLKKAAENG